MSERFIHKTQNDLEQQVSDAESVFGEKLTPSEDNIYSLPLEEIQARYKERYDAYVYALRKNRNEDYQPANIDTERLREWIAALNNSSEYIRRHEAGKDKNVLRPKQFEVYKKIRDFLESGKNAGYVKLPTGVGKTVLFSQVVEALNLKTLIVVPSKVLVSQTGEKLEEFADVEVGKYYQHEKELGRPVTIITYKSFVLKTRDGTLNPDEYGLLILDEAHRSLAEGARNAIGEFSGIKLGFTATPDYAQDKKLSQLLPEEIFEMSIREAFDEGLISSFRGVRVQTELDLSSVPIVTTKTGERIYDPGKIEAALNISARNMAAINLYREAFPGKRAVFYCCGKKHAKDLSLELQRYGIQSDVVIGETKNRDEIFERFHAGDSMALCTAAVLIEGFDEPRIELIMNLLPTFSHLREEQRSGRGLRLDPDNPNKVAYIVDFVDSDSRRQPVTFAEVAETNVAIRPKMQQGGIVDDSSVKDSEKALLDLHIEGIQVIVSTEETIAFVREAIEKREDLDEKVPDRWKTANSLREDLGSKRETIIKTAEGYRREHPDWFMKFNTNKGLVDHYHPDLVRQLSIDLKKAPKDWRTASSLQGEFHSMYTTIATEAEKYRADHPEWFLSIQLNRGMTDHYHPDLIELLRQHFESPESQGWMTAMKLAPEFGVVQRVVADEAEKYRTEHPEWFKMILVTKVRAEHFHPELLTILRAHFERPPQGWKTPVRMQKDLKLGIKTIMETAEKYRSEHPEWFHIYYDSHLKNTEHYAPQLEVIIRETIKKAPEGWRTAYRLSGELKVSEGAIQKVVNQFRGSNPEWFQEFASNAGPTEYFHPTLIQKLLQQFKEGR